MALYVQFYVDHVTWFPGKGLGSDPGKVIAGMGDRAVIQLDPRERREVHHELARDWIRRHEATQRFVAYRLFTGRILSPRYITPVLRPDGTEIPLSAVRDHAAPASARQPARERNPAPRRH